MTETVTETTTPATLDAERPSAYSALDALDAAIATAVRAAEERGYQRGLAERPANRPANRPAGLAGLADRLDAIADRLDSLEVGDDVLDGLEIESNAESVEVPGDSDGISAIASWIDEHGGKTLVDADDVAIDSRSARRMLRETGNAVEGSIALLRDLIRDLRATGA